jgi:ATP-binding cassette, subfamily B, bacterial
MVSTKAVRRDGEARRGWPGFLRGRRAVPAIRQLEMADCHAACLAMTLAFHGKFVSLSEMREAIASGGTGATASAILRAGQRFGLRGRGVRLEPESLSYLPRGSILHWSFQHFVVYDGLSRKGVRIVDPAVGRRVIGLESFGAHFTGVALVFEPAESFEEGGRPRSTSAWRYLRKVISHRGVLVRILVISLLVQIFGLALPLVTGSLVDRVIPERDPSFLGVLGVGAFSLVAFQVLASLVRAHLLLHLRTVMDSQFSLGFIRHLVALPYAFFLKRSVGDLVVRYQSNRMIRETLTSATLSTVLDGPMVIAYLILMLIVCAPMGWLVLGLGVLQVGVFLATRRRYRELVSEDLEVQSRAQSQLVGILQGVETLKASGFEQQAVMRWSHRLVDVLNVSVARGRLSAAVDASRLGLDLAAPLVILIVGAALVIEGRLTLGLMLALNALGVGFLRPLSSLVSTSLELQQMVGHLERIDDVMLAEREPGNDGGAVVRLRGGVVLERVDFRYSSGAPDVLQNVSLAIVPGRKVAIVGRSGAGKSTLARVLVGLHRPTAGHILFDGRDLSSLDLSSVRSQVGVVPQRAHLFGTTIGNNIAFVDPSVSVEAIVEAAKLADVHEDIAKMPMAYDTPLLEGGPSLSGGQRQRIALARALVRRPPILLLDEATSELDTVTENRIMDHLSRLGCTRIVIAHRLSTIANADLIVVLDGGRVAETGTHDELLSRLGPYADLIAAQSRYGRETEARPLFQ